MCFSQNELLGQNLYDYVYEEDRKELTRNLTPDGMQPMSTPSPAGIAQVSEVQAHDNNSSSSEDSTTNHRTNEKTKHFREQRRNFKLRIQQRANSKRDNTQYESFDVSGLLRLAEACKNADTNVNRGRQRGEPLIIPPTDIAIISFVTAWNSVLSRKSNLIRRLN